jgi:YVTN family beta-propeller protein
VAITPDGTHAYVTNFADNTVSVIATASNAVVANVAVGTAPDAVAITPALPFSAFSAKLDISPAGFDLKGTFTLGAEGTINPPPLVSDSYSALGGSSYQIQVEVSEVNLTALANPVAVGLTIGSNTGTTSVTAGFE